MSDETRTTSATGGEKGVKLARYDLIPVDALRQVAEHYGKGAEKYADHNWRKGYEWSKSYAALQRHANAFWGGETFDPDTGSHHMAAVVFHALALITYADEHPGYDDRYEVDAPPMPKLAALLAETPPWGNGASDALEGERVRDARRATR